jgi:hypothetical protein
MISPEFFFCVRPGIPFPSGAFCASSHEKLIGAVCSPLRNADLFLKEEGQPSEFQCRYLP